ncbi:tetratricopeptide repeat protein [Micromonospora sp. NPDC005979]|uniref:tetratricopeptide repeat protein n=1 Tax=Micromonospora sp. NPDC005979 TaxID=3156726 RepID=UPI0033B14E7B
MSSDQAAGVPRIVQHILADGSSKTATLGSGTQHVYLGNPSALASQPTAVSVAPPLGRRDPARPLRGRSHVTKRLAAMLSEANQSKRVHVIHGLGGSGKTAVALEVAATASSRNIHVWWINAGDSALLAAGMHAVARQVGASAEELGQGNAPDVLWNHLQRFPRNWLLVVDNADNPSLLGEAPGALSDGTGWIRPTVPQQGRVLVTSRDATPELWGSWCELHVMDMLAPDDGAQVLLDHTGNRAGSRGEAAALATILGGLPLALRIAGSYLAETTSSPWPEADAIKSFSQYSASIVGDFPPPGGEQLIERVWQLSISLLEKRGLLDAVSLLELLSNLADAPIPYQTVLEPGLLARSATFQGLDGPQLWRILQALNNLAMIDLVLPSAADTSSDEVLTLRVHPLVRHAARRAAASGNRSTYVSLLVIRIGKLTSEASPTLQEGWPRWQYLTPHILHLFHILDDFAGVPDELTALAGSAALAATRYLEERGLHLQAEVELRSIIAAQQRRLGDESSAVLEGRHRLAHILSQRGNLEEARIEHVSVLETTRRVRGEDAPYTLNLRNCLGSLLDLQGKYEEAEAEQRLALETARRALGEDHVQTLNIRHNLGHTLRSRGKPAEAAREHLVVIEAQARTMGPHHRKTLKTRECYALILEDLGEYDAVENELKELTLIREERFGNEDLETIGVRTSYAGFLKSRGRYEAAKQEYGKVIASRRSVLGENHRLTLSARHHLADVLTSSGELEEAETEHRSVLEAERRVLGDDHPGTLQTRYCLSGLLQQRGEYEAAAAEYRVVLDGRRRVLGERHPNTVEALHGLAHVLEHTKEHDEAQAAHQEVLRFAAEVVGEDHPRTLRMRSCLANFLLGRRNYNAARLEFEKVLSGYLRVLGVEHPHTVAVQQILEKIADVDD